MPSRSLQSRGFIDAAADPDEDLAGPRRGLRQVADDDAVDPAEGLRDGGSHASLASPPDPAYGTSRTFPVVCRPSRARWASAASARGYRRSMRTFTRPAATSPNTAAARASRLARSAM